jgi:hypothetical protein
LIATLFALEELVLDAGADHLGELELRDAAEDLQPGGAQVVPVRVRHRDQRLDRLNVLRLVCVKCAFKQET